MPTIPTYPGVYIEEIPSGVRTITGVATSITAFIGRAQRGPVNDPITINNFGDYERIFGGLSLLSSISYAVRDFYLNGGTQAIIVRLHNGATAAQISLPAGAETLLLEAASVGAWGNNLSVLVDYNTKDKDSPSPDTSLFNLTIFETNPNTGQVVNSEKFLNVSVSSSNPRYLPRVLEQNSSLVRVLTISNVRPDLTITLASPPLSPLSSPPTGVPTPIKATPNSGSDGSDISETQFIGPGLAGAKQGLFALEKVDLFNLLCIPPFSLTLDITTSLIAEAVTYCKNRRAMLIVDPPSNWTKKDTAKKEFSDGTFPGISGPVSNYAAIFFPRLKQPNLLRDNQIEEFVPCGAVAGIFARTDAQRGVWKAPAGQDATLIGVPQLSVSMTDDENGELNPLGVNCLRAFPVIGRVVWGARTVEGADRLASEWKYIPVRRTALFIEESLYRGTKWVVFEPNDEPLWAQIRLNVGAFMQSLFRQGAFQGKTPKEAYLVKCDKETTTQNDINQGIVNILVGFAPLKPAEFVIIKIQQLAGQIEV
ncbi:MAG: phage tail sheath C-terminal domain-containing protein [Acidobacteriota bacterium]